MRALSRGLEATLIVNPNAGGRSDRARREVIDQLRSKLDVHALSTTAKDTAGALASGAARDGARLVIAFGGDGHINEVVNGLAQTETTLGIIPGGTMNVLARALGIPLDAHRSVDYLIRALDRPPRVLSLGKIDDRYFTFAAGCGFDAEAAERVERYGRAKRRFGELFFYWSAFRVLAGSFRNRAPTMELKGAFGEVPVAMAIASNLGPYAYLMRRSVDVAPEVRLDGGIDVFGVKSMRLEALPRYAWRVLVSGDLVGHPDVFYASDLENFELTSDQPFGRHVDGEPLPAARSSTFSIAKDALKVRA